MAKLIEDYATSTFSVHDLMKNAPAERTLTPTLTVIAGRAAGKTYKILEGETSLGRAADLTVVIEEDGVSRRHAMITSQGRAQLLSDLGSTNGTLLNGERIAGPTMLRDGDRIQIGVTAIFKFGYQDELEEQMQAKLYDAATRDPLTQAHNRRFFNERLATEWAWAERHQSPCALVAIDADHFKRVNDVYGHPAGDYVLQQLVVSASNAIRKEDLLARIGGEEFMVIARATPRPQALVLAERIRAAVEEHVFGWEGTRLPITISLGVGTSADIGVESPDDLVGRADEFLYRAKENGRNRVEPRAEPVAGKPTL